MAEMGRPKNYSTEEIKNVIDMYVSFTGGTVLLNASKVALYAEKKLNLKNFKYYVINRNPKTKKYIEELNKKITGNTEEKITSSATIFTQIDVRLYQSMSKEKLGKSLSNINTLLEDVSDSNTKLLKENLSLKYSVKEKDIEIKKLNDLVDKSAQNSVESIEQLKCKINEQRETINKLTQSVKQLEEVIHLLWDKEAEIIMKQIGVFENDGEVTNPKRTITDIDESIILVAKDANSLNEGKESEKIIRKFMDRLDNI